MESMERAGRGELWGWVLGTALGCVLVLFAAGRIWVRLVEGGADAVAPTGGELGPVLTPVALAGLAGVVAVLATKGVGRRVVGALLALCGAVAAAATWAATNGDTVTGWLRDRNVMHVRTDLPWEIMPLWPAVAAVGAVLMIAGGVVAILRGSRWAGMSARYDRGADKAGTQARDDKSLWEALDRGDDPTDSR
ncbi:Trp biosynthesis-associated membrane protein [Nonomuraea sp. M3C6]|uniref:Trp biosynthesis-associated membrane protein n=1 Tax=Nonomuraea marmarensis TaxID=3351344 RepID=A0ABW7A3L5_9ACTN